MTFSSGLRHSAIVAAFFTLAGYTSFGCGHVTLPIHYPQRLSAVTVTVRIVDFDTWEPVEGAHVTIIQGKCAKTLETSIGGSAYFYDGLSAGTVRIDISAPGYEKATTSTELIAGYNKEELRLKRRES